MAVQSIFYGLLVLLTIVAYKQRKCWYFIWQVNGWRGVIQQPALWILLMCSVDPKSIMTSIHNFGKYFQFPLAILLFDRVLLYVDDPVTLEGVLTSPECLNKTFLQNGFFANKGLLHAKGDDWKIRRKQLNPAFSHNTLISLLNDFNRVATILKNQLQSELQSNQISFIHLEELVNRAVLEVSCLTTMGVSTNFTQEDNRGIALAYRYLMELTALRILKPWYQIKAVFRFLDKKKFDMTQKAKALVHGFVENIVLQKYKDFQKQEKSQNILAAPSGQTENEDKRKAENRIFIEQLFYLAEQSKLSLEDIMDESQSMVVVSFETVSTCIMNALLCLALNQDCLQKLRLEIHKVFATENSNIPKSDHKTMDLHVGTNHLLNMPYLDMVLNESLRLVTTVPMNMRDVSSQFKLKMLDPKAQHVARIHERKTACHNKIVTVPKGTIIAVDTFNMQRNADYWGPNALEFCPERFSKEGVQDITNHTGRWHSYAYIPFSKGLRTCIGQRYSIYLSKIFLIKLISCYEFTTNVQFKDLQYYEGISLKYRNAKDISFEIHRVNQSHQ